MLKDIFEILKSIGDFFVTIGQFLFDFVKDIIYMIEIVGEAVVQIPDYISWLPVEVVTIIVSIFAIVVIYKILGREG